MRKERRFFSADAGADLQNDVAVIVRVARQQQDTQLLLELRAASLAALDLLARDLMQLGVAQQRFRLRDLRPTGGIGPVGLHDRLQLALLALQLGIPVFNLSQLFEHSAASLVAIFAQCISLPQRRKNVNRPQHAKSAGHKAGASRKNRETRQKCKTEKL